jgi:hypothetical protein
VGVEGFSVDDLEGPRPDEEPDVVVARRGTVLDEAAQPDMGERAPHVGEDLDDRPHLLTS